MVSINDIQKIRAATAFALGGGKVGRVGDVYIDDLTNEPAWVTIVSGRFGKRTLFAPLEGASLRGDRLQLAYSRAVLGNAPTIADTGHISEAEQQSLIDYYFPEDVVVPNHDDLSAPVRTEPVADAVVDAPVAVEQPTTVADFAAAFEDDEPYVPAQPVHDEPVVAEAEVDDWAQTSPVEEVVVDEIAPGVEVIDATDLTDAHLTETEPIVAAEPVAPEQLASNLDAAAALLAGHGVAADPEPEVEVAGDGADDDALLDSERTVAVEDHEPEFEVVEDDVVTGTVEDAPVQQEAEEPHVADDLPADADEPVEVHDPVVDESVAGADWQASEPVVEELPADEPVVIETVASAEEPTIVDDEISGEVVEDEPAASEVVQVAQPVPAPVQSQVPAVRHTPPVAIVAEEHVPISGPAADEIEGRPATLAALSGKFRMQPGMVRETIYRDTYGNIILSVIHTYDDIFGNEG